MKSKVIKRARLPRCVAYTRTFEKSWTRYNNAGRHNMNAVRTVMGLLYMGDPLPAEYLDHELKGAEWNKARELHVEGDFLLVYKVCESQNLLTYVHLGTHSELFG